MRLPPGHRRHQKILPDTIPTPPQPRLSRPTLGGAGLPHQLPNARSPICMCSKRPTSPTSRVPYSTPPLLPQLLPCSRPCCMATYGAACGRCADSIRQLSVWRCASGGRGHCGRRSRTFRRRRRGRRRIIRRSIRCIRGCGQARIRRPGRRRQRRFACWKLRLHLCLIREHTLSCFALLRIAYVGVVYAIIPSTTG